MIFEASEGYHLSELLDDGSEIDYKFNQNNEMQDIYSDNKLKQIGSNIICPVCRKIFKKRTKNHSFCSNQRTTKKGINSCKDKFWNRINPRGYFKGGVNYD